MTAHAAEDIQKHVRTYLVVFASLGALTIITVAISYMHLPIKEAIVLALVVATIKASLVALFFMHLISEQKTIYWLLGLTATFFVVLAYLPITWDVTLVEQKSLWDSLPMEGSAAQAAGSHGAAGDGHGHEAEAAQH